MPFSQFKLHPDLLRGLKDLGFARPTPIQADAIPPALEGKDVLACAMTGSGKTVAFLLPILHQLIGKPRGTTRALIITPTRELAAQILEDLNDLTVHTPINGAAVFGGVGMGPQEHAFRSGVDVIVGTPGRLLDHFRAPYAKLAGIEFLVLDEADRMLDMGFLPDIRRVLRHIPKKRQTLFFSATMPPPIAQLTQEMLHNPVTINLERRSAPATGITQAVYPVLQPLKAPLLLKLLQGGEVQDALVFTRTKHRADRLAKYLARAQGQRRADPRQPLAGAADAGAGGIQEGALQGARRDRHRGARHRRHRARPRHQLRRADAARRLHPPRRPHGARRDDRRRVHAGVVGGRRRPARHREGDRAAAAARDGAGLRLRERAGGAARGAARAAHRGNPRAQGRGAHAGPRERGAPGDARRRHGRRRDRRRQARTRRGRRTAAGIAAADARRSMAAPAVRAAARAVRRRPAAPRRRPRPSRRRQPRTAASRAALTIADCRLQTED